MHWAGLQVTIACCLLGGCVRMDARHSGLPDRFEVDIGQLQIRSDVDIDAGDPALEELKQLRSEIVDRLDLPPPRRPVVVHLFSDERRYQQYMESAHPGLPPRRAFFIGTPTELAVFAHWSPNVVEDLRHEYTHGILHASLRTVPLWLDEGLAEYFETRTIDSQRRHPTHVSRLGVALQNGWQPDLRRLEQLENVDEMQRADYQEAWAWIHFLLHEASDGRALLVDYCQSLRNTQDPPRFSTELNQLIPDAELRLASYLSTSLVDQSDPSGAP